MAKLIETQLPQPPRTYLYSQFNQLIKRIQHALSKDIQTSDEAEEDEAVGFFLGK